MSSLVKKIVLMPFMSLSILMPLSKPESSLFGRSIYVASPVTMNLAFMPIRVRNIFS